MTHALHILHSMACSQVGIACIGICKLCIYMRNIVASEAPANVFKPDHSCNNQDEGLDTEMSRSFEWNVTESESYLSLTLSSLGTPDVKASIDLVKQ